MWRGRTCESPPRPPEASGALERNAVPRAAGAVADGAPPKRLTKGVEVPLGRRPASCRFRGVLTGRANAPDQAVPSAPVPRGREGGRGTTRRAASGSGPPVPPPGWDLPRSRPAGRPATRAAWRTRTSRASPLRPKSGTARIGRRVAGPPVPSPRAGRSDASPSRSAIDDPRRAARLVRGRSDLSAGRATPQTTSRRGERVTHPTGHPPPTQPARQRAGPDVEDEGSVGDGGGGGDKLAGGMIDISD